MWAGVTVREQATLIHRIAINVPLAGTGRFVSISQVGVSAPTDDGDTIFSQKFKAFLPKLCAIGRRRPDLADATIKAYARSADQPSGNPEAALGRPQQQQTAVRGLVAAVEIDCEFLTRDGWQIEREQRIVGHGGCGSGWAREADRLNNELLRDPNALRHARRPIFNALMHGSG